MKFNFLKSKFIFLTITLIIFSMAGGFFGELISRVYLFDTIFNLPSYREINLTGSNNNSNLIIRDAKKVVVEQDAKIEQTIQNINENMVAIYKEKPKSSNYLENLYFFNDISAQGIILTSDGWLIANLSKSPINEKNLDDFFISTGQGKTYSIDKIVFDTLSEYSFLHMKDAKDLPVSQLANENDMTNGKSIIAYGWNRESSILNISSKIKQKIYSSDIVNDEYSFSGDLNTANEKIFAYDLAGKFVGFVNKENNIFPVYNLYSALNGILKKGKISRIKLGVFYIDLSNYISRSDKIKGSVIAKNTDGVAIAKNSPALLAGLKENDIITHVNNIEINEINNLSILIQKYKSDDTVNLVYDRAGEKNNLNIILDEY